MTVQEMDELKKENLLLQMHNRRLKEDLEKLQNIIKDILIVQVDGSDDETKST